MLRKVEISYLEATEEGEKLTRVTEILSDAVYTCLKQERLVRKESPLRGTEN